MILLESLIDSYKHVHSIANSSNCISEVFYSLMSFSLLLDKSVINLFKS